jgi:hypothetical protein
MEMLLKQLLKRFNLIKKGLSPFFLCSILSTLLSCSEQRTEITAQTDTEFWDLNALKDNIEDGDIILKMGYGTISKIIAKQLNEKHQISHCAIVYKKDSSMYIIHSVSGEISDKDGVQKASFSEFYNDIKPNSLFVLRHKSDKQIRSNISTFASHYLSKLIPFDNDFNHSDSSKLYCSELVNLALYNTYNKNYFKTKKIGVTSVYTFNSIIESSDFIVVNKKH